MLMSSTIAMSRFQFSSAVKLKKKLGLNLLVSFGLNKEKLRLTASNFGNIIKRKKADVSKL